MYLFCTSLSRRLKQNKHKKKRNKLFLQTNFNWSGRRDLNPRHQPWQGCALPLSYTRTPYQQKGILQKNFFNASTFLKFFILFSNPL